MPNNSAQTILKNFATQQGHCQILFLQETSCACVSGKLLLITEGSVCTKLVLVLAQVVVSF